MLYIHDKTPGNTKKPAATFRIAAGSLKVLCFFLGRQHFVFKLRRSALLRKEVAVSKGEIEKCTSANHDSATIGSPQKPVKTFSVRVSDCIGRVVLGALFTGTAGGSPANLANHAAERLRR